MSETPRSDPRLDEERLLNALVSRGLVSAEEAQAGRSGAGGEAGADALLARLTRGGALTAAQARRAKKELAALLGQQIPGYLLLEKLGQGAMGVVYKARQVSMDRLVAVKVLHPRLAADPEFLRRLTREAHVAAKLSHNNIVQAIDVGSAGPLHYFVMELVEGKTIRQELDAGKVYGEREALEIVIQIAQALGHASKRGLVHRDVKPANIVLTADGVAKLADLGMARDAADLTQVKRERGLAIGTPYYIAPEQVRGRDDIDVRADLYSLGATLYHMTTGRPPFPRQGRGAPVRGAPERGADAAGPPQPAIVVRSGRGGRVPDGEGPAQALRQRGRPDYRPGMSAVGRAAEAGAAEDRGGDAARAGGGRRGRGGRGDGGAAVGSADAVGVDRRAGRPPGAERAGEPDFAAAAVKSGYWSP